VIYAANLSQTAIFEALHAGHLYLSAGPQLTLTAQTVAGQSSMMGDTIRQAATLTSTWAACPADAKLRVIADGRLLIEQATGDQGTYQWSTTPAQAHWYVVEVRSASGEILAITNPIFLDAA
jgi:hypothetical protein